MDSKNAPIVAIFTDVAPKYEFLNKAMTAGRDRHWRDTMLRLVESSLGRTPQIALDLATGTGDVPRMMTARWTTARVIGTDPTPAMLAEAKKRGGLQIEWQEGFAEKIDMPNESVDVITIAFGFRNIPENNRAKAIQEAWRVLRPGGIYAILELGLPRPGATRRVYATLLQHIMPRFAGLFSPRGPYEYLASSILKFPEPVEIRQSLTKAKFVAFNPRCLTGGMCWLFVGKKPGSQEEIIE